MRRQRFDQINIVPFVDIVLVLLVIVLATATFLKQGSVPINLPEQTNSQPQSKSDNTIIAIDANGSYYLDDKLTQWGKLNKEINNLDTNTTKLLLRTDKQTPFEYFSKLMILLREKGFKKISIATEATQQ